MSATSEQKQFVRLCKGTAVKGGVGLRFEVRSELGQTVGNLRAIDASITADDTFIYQMVRWRRQSAGYFLSEFEVAFDRTRTWLETVVLPSDDRVLFLVEDESCRRIGHYGVANISSNALELDNGIRGETGGHPRLFYYVELFIIHLGFLRLNVEQARVGAFKDNFMARKLHRSVGFLDKQTQLLAKVSMPNGDMKYVPADDVDVSLRLETREYIHLALDREDFYEKHSWLKRRKEF